MLTAISMGPWKLYSHKSSGFRRGYALSDRANSALSRFLLAPVPHPSVFSSQCTDFCRMRKQPSQVTRLVSNYHLDVLQLPSQELRAVQGEVGASSPGAS